MPRSKKVEAVEEVEVTETETTEEATEEKAPAGPAKLIRGRMPLPLVWHIRFKESVETLEKNEEGEEVAVHKSDSAVAKDFFTTAGKIMDIRTNRNFKYLTEDTTFDQADIDAAKDQLRKNIAECKMRGADEPSQDYSEDDAKPLFDILDGMVSDKSSIADDRAAYNEANPRKKKEESAETEVEAAPESDTDGDSGLDDLVG